MSAAANRGIRQSRAGYSPEGAAADFPWELFGQRTSTACSLTPVSPGRFLYAGYGKRASAQLFTNCFSAVCQSGARAAVVQPVLHLTVVTVSSDGFTHCYWCTLQIQNRTPGTESEPGPAPRVSVAPVCSRLSAGQTMEAAQQRFQRMSLMFLPICLAAIFLVELIFLLR
jgi:hypothetical protein